MANNERIILVAGATGKQGGGVARRLLEQGFRVRALTRDPEKPAARALSERGAEVVQGDLNDRASLDGALQGAYGVFSVQAFPEAGVEGEIPEGKAMADAAKAAGVQHFVYSSVGSAHRNTGIPHFESKWQVEQHVRAIGLPYTILRPVFFMQNWQSMAEMIRGGTLYQPLDPGKPLQQLDVDEIGTFAALAFAHPDQWLGREVELAGDELTMPQVAETFSAILGKPVQYVQIPFEAFQERAGTELAIMYRWFNDVGYEADIPALRNEYPQLSTLEDYLGRAEWLREGKGAAG